MKVLVEYTALHELELDLPDHMSLSTARAEAFNEYTKRQHNSNGKMSRYPYRISFPSTSPMVA